MKSSILSAFYTPEHVVKAIGAVLAESGIVPQKLLDPSAGIGIFPGHIGKPDGTTETVCIEQDALTAKVLAALYPENKVINDGFQSVGDSLDGRFDMVASNIPFGNFRVFDMGFDRSKDQVRNMAQGAIHNYFFVKGVDTLREGGVLAFITTRGVMDSPGNRPVRDWLVSHCDLLSAVRLPDDLFKDNAGTEAGTDIIILQKRSDKNLIARHEQLFVETQHDRSFGITINSTFVDGRNSLSTYMRAGKDQYGKPCWEFRFEGTPDEMGAWLTDMLAKDIRARFDHNLYLSPGGNSQASPAAQVVDAVAEVVDQVHEQGDWDAPEDVSASGDLNPLWQTEEPSSFTEALEEWITNPPSTPEENETKEQEIGGESEPEVVADTSENEPFDVANYMHYASVSHWREPGNLAKVDHVPQPPSIRQRATANPVRNLRRRNKPQQAKPEAGQLDLFAQSAPSNPVVQSENSAPPQEKPRPIPHPYSGIFEPHYREGTVVEDGGHIGALGPRRADGTTFFPLELKRGEEARLRHYITLRDISAELYETEIETRQPQGELRRSLNLAFDSFTAAFGNLNDKQNAKLFLLDPSGAEVLSLERWEEGKPRKADILNHPVAFDTNEVTQVASVDEALVASLNKYGAVELGYMENLCGVEASQIIDDLQGRIFFNPLISKWEVRDRFISGNVIEKVKHIEEYFETHPRDHHGDTSLTALKASVPERITYEELDFNFGERWIPAGVYSKFASWLFNADVTIKYSNKLDAFDVKYKGWSERIGTEYMVRGESRRYNGIDLMEHALVNTIPDITKTIRGPEGKDIKVRDGQKIQMADTIITKIRTEFTDWLDRQNPEFKQRLCDIYNDKFNCFVKPKYDGSHQQFPGLDMASLKRNFGLDKLYDSQKDVVWMLKQNGGGVCDHEVGTGKTLTMCIAAMEMKRLGLAKKPMIIGLKANAKEIARTFKIAYPNARVIYPSEKDFTPQNRVRLLNDIKNNDWDCIVLTHDQFARIPQSPDIQRQIYEDEINDIEENLEVLKRDGENVSKWMLKGLEIKKINAEAKLEKLDADMRDRRDEVADFEKMGIDHIFVDESQQFKNLMFNTRHARVAGLGNAAGSQRAANLLFAIRTIQQLTGKDLGATFLSGTTISNSLTELYLIFKYLRPKALEKQDINCFDAWAAVFAKKSTDYEFSVTNEIIQKERFRYFIKVPELANFYNEITDFRTAEDVGVDRPALAQSLVTLQPTGDQLAYLGRLVKFAAGGPASLIGHKELTESQETARMLLTTTYANKMSLDMRMIDSEGYGDHPGNKASACAERIAEYYKRYDAYKGTQLVFSDLSVYNPGLWNIYDEIKRKLVEEHGIPAHEVRFIQEATTEARREKMIEAANDGSIRVLFGSTQKLGTGVNAQKRVVAMHHLDIPWTPKDLKQRTGRGQRKGNMVAKEHAGNVVNSHVYATERSLDSYKFGILTNKQLFIDQIKKGTLGVRTIDEGAMSEDGGMSYAEMAAITSGNTDLLELAKMDKKIAALESERAAFVRSKSDAKYRLDTSADTFDYHKGLIENFKADLECREKLVLKDGGGNHTAAYLQVDGALNKSAKAMADRLHEVERTARTEGGYEKVGTLGDFTIFVRTERYEIDHRTMFSNTFSIGGTGKVKYNHNNGKLPQDDLLAVTSFAKALDKIEGLIEKSEKTAEELAADIPVLRRVVESPFSKDFELQSLRVERDVLDRKIQLGLKPIREQLARDDAEECDVQDHRNAAAHDHFNSHVIVGGVPSNMSMRQKM
jgi:N12 class adenine-specific DNA methylase